MSILTKLPAPQFGPRKLAKVAQRAKQLGLTPRQYIERLVEDDLAIEREAQSSTFAQIMAPVREEFERSGMSERELGELVDRARCRSKVRQDRK